MDSYYAHLIQSHSKMSRVARSRASLHAVKYMPLQEMENLLSPVRVLG